MRALGAARLLKSGPTQTRHGSVRSSTRWGGRHLVRPAAHSGPGPRLDPMTAKQPLEPFKINYLRGATTTPPMVPRSLLLRALRCSLWAPGAYPRGARGPLLGLGAPPRALLTFLPPSSDKPFREWDIGQTVADFPSRAPRRVVRSDCMLP